MRYICPLTGRRIARSAGTRNQREAIKVAAKWEAELREGRYAKQSRMAWEDFRAYYIDNAIAGLAENSIVAYESTLNAFARLCKPSKLSNLTTERVTAFATELRKEGLREATVGRHLRHLKAVARWANKQGLLPNVPSFTMPKRAKGAKSMRGRAVVGEEFDRMIEATPKVVENVAAASWQFYLRGLWLSGLRLSESITLSWTDTPGAIVVDMAGRRPMLRIPAEAEKGFQDRTLPMTPDFARHLEAIPEADRWGRVFKLLASDGSLFQSKRWDVGRIVSKIGKAAGVVVDEHKKGDKIVRKFASAHDLRRAFGFRWAMRVMPADLKDLMRHEDIGTTMKFYVGQDAEAMADTIWATDGNTIGNTGKAADSPKEKHPVK
jgi:integrase